MSLPCRQATLRQVLSSCRCIAVILYGGESEPFGPFFFSSWTWWLIGPNYTRRRQSITDFPSFQVTSLFLPFYFCNWRTDYRSCLAHLWARFLPEKGEILDRILSNTHAISFYSSVSLLYSFSTKLAVHTRIDREQWGLCDERVSIIFPTKINATFWRVLKQKAHLPSILP
jgi:hypothetical protein